MNRVESWTRNFAIMRLRGLRAMKFCNRIVNGRQVNVFTTEECKTLQELVDSALSRMDAETETARHERFMKERLERLELIGQDGE